MMNTTDIALFEEKEVRKVWHDDQRYFVLEDVITVLTDSKDPKQYIQRMKQRDSELEKGWVQIVHTLITKTSGGAQKMNCVNTEGAFRLIQSIPSPKAEPFKLRLAKVGYQRIQEIENPELAQERMKIIYEQKGYPKEWIDKRLRGIAVRQELTDEWKHRGAQSEIDYAILTNEIMDAAFGMTVKEYKEYKGLARHNLRDHMTDLEIILTMLGEATTTKFHRDRDSRKFDALQKDAHDGGSVAGRTKEDIESHGGKKISTKENYLHLEEKNKLGDKSKK